MSENIFGFWNPDDLHNKILYNYYLEIQEKHKDLPILVNNNINEININETNINKNYKKDEKDKKIN